MPATPDHLPPKIVSCTIIPGALEEHGEALVAFLAEIRDWAARTRQGFRPVTDEALSRLEEHTRYLLDQITD